MRSGRIPGIDEDCGRLPFLHAKCRITGGGGKVMKTGVDFQVIRRQHGGAGCRSHDKSGRQDCAETEMTEFPGERDDPGEFVGTSWKMRSI